MSNSLKSKLKVGAYKIYRIYLYNDLENIRGSTRFMKGLERFVERGLPSYEEEPSSIFDYSWDNLLILDSCRYDLFEQEWGDCVKRTSMGSDTFEYITETYSEGEYKDVVYISACSYTTESKFKDFTGRSPDEVFHRAYNLTEMDDYWDSELGTVPPSAVIDFYERIKDRHQDKNLIFHFMQPHYPFINYNLSVKYEGLDRELSPNLQEQLEVNEPWGLGFTDKVSDEELWCAYRANLNLVRQEIEEKLLPLVKGKTVITSDHGNFVGENGLYGHRDGLKSKVLREVPWYEVNQK